MGSDQKENQARRFALQFEGLKPMAIGAVLLQAAGLVAAGLWVGREGWAAVADHGVIWAILGGSMLLSGALVLRVWQQVSGLTLVGNALGCWASGEPQAAALKITKSQTLDAKHWNRLIDQVASMSVQLNTRHATEQIASIARVGGSSNGALDVMPQGVVLTDAKGVVTSVNGAACRMLMLDRDRILGKPLDQFFNDPGLVRALRGDSRSGDRRGSEDSPAHPDGVDRRGGDRRSGSFECRIEHDDSPEAILRITVRSLGKDEARETLVVIEDVTQQRAADRSRNLFVAQATHELRTPLTNIGLYVERAIDLADHEAAERSECLNVINSEVLRLGRLVEEVLSVSEIEAGSLKVRRDDVRLPELLERMESEYSPQAKTKDIKLSFDVAPKLSVLQGDREKIALAMHNLIGNALKYTPKGGGVQVAVDEADGKMMFKVTDTGIGIGPDDLPRVFEKFYRADDQRLQEITGSGLGLALAREVIRLHGGDITVESSLNEGSTFTLALPINSEIKV